MERPGVIGIARQHALQRADDLLRARLRRALGRPEIPRPEVHHRVREERGSLEVAGESLRDVAHGVGVRTVEALALGGGVQGVTLGERVDERALRGSRGRGQSLRLLDGLARAFLALGIGGVVVVRPLGDREAPVAHRACGIESRSLAERPLRLVMVERVDEPQALIEPPLRRRAGGDLRRIAAERVVEHRRAGGRRVRHAGMSGGVLDAPRACGGDHQERDDEEQPARAHARNSWTAAANASGCS
jgi:hypothetical protein